MMLHLIKPVDRRHYQDILADMFSRRDFNLDGPDPFDLPEAVYFAYVDDRYGLCGTARLLPTAGAHLSSMDTSKELFRGSYAWECSALHFMVPKASPLLRSEIALTSMASRFFYELYMGLRDFSLAEHIKQIIVVGFQEGFESLWQAGWPLMNTHPLKSLWSQEGDVLASVLSMGEKSYQEFEEGRRQFEQKLACDGSGWGASCSLLPTILIPY